MPCSPLSFIIPIKNRTNIKIVYDGKPIELKLFEKNLKSLFNLIKPDDKWQIVIVDFKSTDVHMSTWIKTLHIPNNCEINIVTLDEIFNKGKGLNIGMKHCKHDYILSLDTDMQIFTRQFFEDIEKYVVKEKKAFFPICWSYTTPQHTEGIKRTYGHGINCVAKKDFVSIPEFKQWGKEDDINFEHFEKLKKVVRPYYERNYIHQWHPNDLEFKNKYYKSKN
jgi:glycosyltransferase involved in cell wall biosynthesis